MAKLRRAGLGCLHGSAGGYTTVGMSECVNSEYQFWDRRLNQTYQSVLSDAEKMDQEMADLGSAAEKQVPYLREMQRNWIAYRDAACQFERSRWGGGTGAARPRPIACCA